MTDRWSEQPDEKKWERKDVIEYIENLIPQVEETSKEERETIKYRERMVMLHYAFANKFKNLFKLVLDQGRDFDVGELRRICQIQDDCEEGKKDFEEENKRYGQEKFDKYVKPLIDNKKN